MDAADVIARLESGAPAVAALVTGVADGAARLRPGPEDWSILEVVAHLLDEEREDFRPRLDVVLHRPGEAWSPIDPQGWVASRAYNERDPAETLAAFLGEREASLAWLRGLASPDWEARYEAPWGPIRAGDLLAAWAAHDTLHLRQLVELRRFLDEAASIPYDPAYAGAW